MIMYQIGEKIRISIVRQDPEFDLACEQAYSHAVFLFGRDGDGHFRRVEGHDRYRDTLVVEFRMCQHRGGMTGQVCEYTFEAWVSREEEE